MKYLKNYLLIFGILCIVSEFADAQTVKRITSTGLTTGHIATLSIENTTNKPVIFELGTAIIPSREFQNETGIQKSQPQIHTGQIEQEIAPGETVEIPVEGFCLDVGKPPAPEGEPFPSLDEWVRVKPTSREPVNPGRDFETPNLQTDTITSPDIINPAPPPRPIVLDDLPPSFQPLKESKPAPLPPDPLNPGGGQTHSLLIPGTDLPFNYTIDISEHPEDAAHILFPMVDQIILTYDSLQNEGLISTPFLQDEARQKEAVIQQTIWVTTSLLQGEDYDIDDFAERMAEQFEESSGVKMDEIPEQQQEQFNQGIEQFWNNFELVGEKAKVIRTKASYLPGEVTIEEDLSLSFIELTYGKYDLDDVTFRETNRLVNFNNEKIFLILIYDAADPGKKSVWLKLDTEKDKWGEMTKDDIFAFGTEMMEWCSLFSPPECPTGCKGDNIMRGAGAGVPDDTCIPDDIYR